MMTFAEFERLAAKHAYAGWYANPVTERALAHETAWYLLLLLVCNGWGIAHRA